MERRPRSGVLSRKGYKKDDYKAYGDLDNDGANNYEEYVAGTNPLDPKDRFSVREMAVEVGREDYLRFKFLAVRGRSGGLPRDLRAEGKREAAVLEDES